MEPSPTEVVDPPSTGAVSLPPIGCPPTHGPTVVVAVREPHRLIGVGLERGP